MKLTFRTKLFLPLIISWVCLLILMTFSALHDKTLRLEERKTQLSYAGDLALSVVKEYGAMVSAGTLSEEEARKQALARIKSLRFGTTGYFTILDSHAVLMHPFKPELVGTDPRAFKDPDGTLVYVDALNMVQEREAGFTRYLWSKPNEKTPVPKIAYDFSYKPWNWTFMTGAYIDDVDAAFYKDLWSMGALLAAIGIALTAIVLVLVRGIERSMGGEPGHAVEIARRISTGDLDVNVVVKADDRSSLMFAMKAMRDELISIVSRVRSGTDTIATASSQIAAGNLDLSSRTEQQASSLEETASSMEELTSTVRQSADHARQANELAVSASDIAAKGGAVVGEVVDTMASINESSKRIVEIIGVIDGIAFQTNILALNAAVEAARAGEQGRGFAVVASEVRNLAQRSAAAAKEIKSLINNSVDQVAVGAKLVDEAGMTMKEIVESVKRVTDIMSEISAATQEQTSGIDEINRAISQMDQVTQQNAALVEEAAAASQSMQDQAARLAEVVSVFKIGGHLAGNITQANRTTKPHLNKATLPANRAAVTVSGQHSRITQGGDWEEF